MKWPFLKKPISGSNDLWISLSSPRFVLGFHIIPDPGEIFMFEETMVQLCMHRAKTTNSLVFPPSSSSLLSNMFILKNALSSS